MNNGRPMLWTFAVFVLGLALGGGVVHQYHKKYLGSMIEGGPKAYHEQMKHKFMADLDLDRAQRERMEPIMNELHEKIRAVRRQAEPAIHNLFMEARPRVVELLRPEQVRKLEEMEARRKHRRGPDNETKP